MASGADVQLEGGNWSRIHNLILEQLAKADLNGREAKCLFFLLRMTYGKQQKHHEISLTLWTEGTGIDKRHVKPVIDKLIARNIIQRAEGKQGRGHTAIYGFNKYFEDWDKPEKVPSTVPFEKVPPEVPFIEEKVPSTVPEKVPSTVPIKERTAESSLLAAESEDAKNLMILAYQTVCKLGPPMREPKGRAALITASELIERFGYPACLHGVAILKERYEITVSKNRNGISAPLAYLRSIMESDLDMPVKAPAKVDFAYEELI